MQAIIDFILAHQLVLAGVAIAVLDLLFALSKNIEGNGILHQLYLWLKKITTKDTPPPSA